MNRENIFKNFEDLYNTKISHVTYQSMPEIHATSKISSRYPIHANDIYGRIRVEIIIKWGNSYIKIPLLDTEYKIPFPYDINLNITLPIELELRGYTKNQRIESYLKNIDRNYKNFN